MSIFWKLVDETQLFKSPEATRHHNLTKLLILLPLRADLLCNLHYETPCMCFFDKLSKTNIFFSCFEGTRGEKTQIFRTLAYVRKYIKNLGITFQVSNKLTSAVKEGLRLWLKVDILNKNELEFATNFAKKVPLWYKKAKSDTRLFAAHQCK